MIPKSCRRFGQDHATKQVLGANWRFDLIHFAEPSKDRPRSGSVGSYRRGRSWLSAEREFAKTAQRSSAPLLWLSAVPDFAALNAGCGAAMVWLDSAPTSWYAHIPISWYGHRDSPKRTARIKVAAARRFASCHPRQGLCRRNG